MTFRILATCCVALFLLGGLSFLCDVFNPTTPDPDVLLRALAWATALFLILEHAWTLPLLNWRRIDPPLPRSLKRPIMDLFAFSYSLLI